MIQRKTRNYKRLNVKGRIAKSVATTFFIEFDFEFLAYVSYQSLIQYLDCDKAKRRAQLSYNTLRGDSLFLL